MKIILITLKKMLFWSYERGSWQYDVMCVLILAFIFLSPNRFFQSHSEVPLQQKESNAANISRSDSEASSPTGNYVAQRRNQVNAVQFTEKQHETK